MLNVTNRDIHCSWPILLSLCENKQKTLLKSAMIIYNLTQNIYFIYNLLENLIFHY